MRPSTLRAAVYEAVIAAGAAGRTCHELVQAVDHPLIGVRSSLAKCQRAGETFGGQPPGLREYRHFGTAAARDAWVAANTVRKPAPKPKVLAVVRPRPLKASQHAAGPVDYSRATYTIAPPMPDRWAPAAGAQGIGAVAEWARLRGAA